MGEDETGYGPGNNLRRRAEHRIRVAETAAPDKTEAMSPPPARDPDRLIHELQVHQIELEMQNDELQRTCRELESAHARYLDLYDFAPVAYFTVDMEERILESNLAAATLLGLRRADLIRRPFPRLIIAEDQDIYSRHRKALLESGDPHSAEIRMLRADAVSFWVHLKATVTKKDDGSAACRIVVSDIDERKKAGQERENLIAELQKTLETVKQLSGLLPICMSCKKIRDDQGNWSAIENYISRHSEAEFTHGACPECMRKLYGEWASEKK